MSHEVHVENLPDRASWLAARRTMIGASEVPALFGVLPGRWGSPLSIFCEKTGRVPPEEKTGSWLQWGHLMENPIAEIYAAETGRKIWSAGSFAIARHPRVSCMGATPDRWVIEAEGKPGRGVLEIKRVTFSDEKWEEGPPDYVQIQVQAQLAVTGFEWGSIAALMPGDRFTFFDVERNPDFIAEMEAVCAEFWERHVVRGEMPPIDTSEATARTLRRMHPKDDGSTKVLTSDIESLWDEFEEVKARIRKDEKRKEELDTLLRGAMGQATFGLLPGGRLLSLKHIDVRESSPRPAGTQRRWKLEKKKGTENT